MIIVTGHKGQIGSLLVKRLEEILPNWTIGIDIRDGMNVISCSLPNDFGIECIYHLAAQSSVESSWKDPVHDMDNIRMVARLVKRYPDIKIIYANSAASIDPKSPYGFSKWACGEYLKKFHKNWVNCIFPNVYGGSDKSVVDIFKDKDEVTVFGDGLQTRDYVHVKDIVEGLILAKDWECGDYFMGSGIPTNVLQLAEGKKINFAPARKEARESVLINSCPNWKPKIKVLDYIKNL